MKHRNHWIAIILATGLSGQLPATGLATCDSGQAAGPTLRRLSRTSPGLALSAI